MQKVEELSRSQGIHSFKVDTNFDNFYMHRMLEKLGFSIVVKYYIKEEAAWHMRNFYK